MATNIQSSALDFDNIKNNLKAYFQSVDEFRDYNFEASGLSNILDVLAYNTHLNGLIANFVLNEAYLNTAQLRSSTISLGQNLGYIPRSVTSSKAVVNINYIDNFEYGDGYFTLPAYTKFTTEVGGQTFTFVNVKGFTSVSQATEGPAYYMNTFVDENGSADIPIYEGSVQVRNFTAINPTQYPTYYLSDTNIDTASLLVRVFPQGSSSYTEYTNIKDLTEIKSDSTFYVIREAPTGGYELYFGDGNTLGVAPAALSKIQVTYLRPTSTGANGASSFTFENPSITGLPFAWANEPNTFDVANLITKSVASGGAAKESIDSIRQFAPLSFRAQNRMVTAEDYTSLIRRNYGNLLYDVTSWGGEDNIKPEFGVVYVSLNFSDNITNNTRIATRRGIEDLQDNFGVASFKIRFVDPETTFIKLTTEVQFSKTLTSDIGSVVTTNVSNAISNFFDESIDERSFATAFRRSKMLTYIEENVSGILSSKSDVELGIDLDPLQFSIADTIQTLSDLTVLDNPGTYMTSLIQRTLAGNYDTVANSLINNSHTSSSYNDIVAALQVANGKKEKVLRYPGAILEPDDNEYIITSTEFDYLASNKNIIRNKLNSTDLEIYNVTTNDILGTYGSYDPTNGTVTIDQSFVTSGSLSGGNNIRIFAKPADPSFLVAQRNGLISYDTANSTVTAVGSGLIR